MPSYTFRRSQQATSISHQADKAKRVKLETRDEDARRAAAFAEVLRDSQIEKELQGIVKLAASLKNFGEEPSTRRGVLVKEAGKALKLAEKVATLIQKMKDSSGPKDFVALVGVAKKLSDAQHKLDAAATAVHALQVSLALILFVSMTKKAISAMLKLKTTR